MNKLFVIVILCVLGAALTKAKFDKEQMMKEFMAFADGCTAQVGATPNDIQELIKELPASNKAGKCMRACIMKKYKLMGADGKFDKAVGAEKAKLMADGDAEKLKMHEEMVAICSVLAVPDDECEAAEMYGLCFKQEGEQRGLERIEF